MPGYTSSASRKAFTLIEVMVALAIFAGAAVVISNSFMNGLLALEASQRGNDLQNDARFVINRVLAIADKKALEAGGHMQTLGHGKVEWKAEIEPVDVVDLFRLKLHLEFEGAPDAPPSLKARKVDSEHLVLRPDWSEPAARSALMTERKRALESLRPSAEGQEGFGPEAGG